jgi:hypothetical protein
LASDVGRWRSRCRFLQTVETKIGAGNDGLLSTTQPRNLSREAHPSRLTSRPRKISASIPRTDAQPSDAEGDFGPGDILYASEIGLVADDVPAASRAAGTAMKEALFWYL